MGKIYFSGRIAELNVSSINDEELELIQDGECDSDVVRDEMTNIFMCYNAIVGEGEFIDEEDDEIDVDFMPIYCSNIGEPALDTTTFYGEDIIDHFADVLGGDSYDEFFEKLKNNGQFNEDMEIIDPELVSVLKSAYSVHGEDSEDIEHLASVVSIEKGDLYYDVSEEIDVEDHFLIGTHEIEDTGTQIAVIIIQCVDGKIKMEELEPELDSSSTQYTTVYYMNDVSTEEGHRFTFEDYGEV